MSGMETGGMGGMPLAAAAPLLCAAHCLATPVFVVAAPAVADYPGIEVGLMIVSAAIGVAAGAGGVRLHGEARVWLPIVVGLALWLAGMISQLPAHEQLLTVTGGLMLAGGLFWNGWLRHRTTCASCSGSNRG